MRFRSISIAMVCVITAACITPTYARGIRVDPQSHCNTLASAGPSVSLTPGVSGASAANPGVSGNVYSDCYIDYGQPEATLQVYAAGFAQWNYVWAPQPQTVIGQPLSNLDISAEVAVWNISGPGAAPAVTTGGVSTLVNISGDWEVEFDYPDYSAGSAVGSCNESAATLTWLNTYTYTGAGNVGLCGSSSDFLFSKSGQLVGYVDDTGVVHLGLDPLGWGTTRTAGAPEPATLGLFSLGLLGLRLSRRRASRSPRA
jgi:hypothetical protein